MTDLRARIRADQAMATAKAERNRSAMPGVAAIVDHLRDVFGAGVRVQWAEESGRTVGKRDEETGIDVDRIIAADDWNKQCAGKHGRREAA